MAKTNMTLRISCGLWTWLLLLGLAVSCRTAGPVQTPKPDSTSTAQKYYQTAGVIKELKPDGKTAVIAHEKIPGYMEAMTMPFPVKDSKELANLKQGDKVTFRMVITPKEGWIDRLSKVDIVPEEPTQIEETFHVSRDVEPLAIGDRVPEYHFTNELGKAVHLSQFRGQAVALTFFYTRCPFPNFCPRLTSKFEDAQKKLATMPKGPKNWRLLSISFDPRRDTPQNLHYYARKYAYDPKHWSFLTGELIEIDAIAEQFGEAFWREGATMGHNQRTAVLDTQGRFQRVFIGSEWSVDDLVAEIVKAARAKPGR